MFLQHADVAQLVEQRFRKPSVTSSSLVIGSKILRSKILGAAEQPSSGSAEQGLA
jgi:hypothetical protein